MAITYGEKWAIYLLLAQHSGTVGTKSEFRTRVEDYFHGGTGLSLQDAVVKAAQEEVSPAITNGDIGALQSLDAPDLRNNLGMAASFYIPGSGSCPPGPAQSKIIGALKTIQP